MSIIEAAGLEPDEVAAIVRHKWTLYRFTDPSNTAIAKLVIAARAEINAVRPIEPGDRVRVVWTSTEWLVHTVHEGGVWLWAFGVEDGLPATLRVDSVERVA